MLPKCNVLPAIDKTMVDRAEKFDHPEGMSRALFISIALALVAGCGSLTGPTKQVETAVPQPEKAPQPGKLPPPLYISTSGQSSPRPIYDYNVAPAQYSLKPLEQWTEQEAAAEALGRIGPPAIPQLIASLQSADPETRLIAAQVLARMGSDAKEAVPHLIPLLKDPDERIRKAAARTLGRIGPEAAAAVPELMEALLEQARPASGEGTSTPTP